MRLAAVLVIGSLMQGAAALGQVSSDEAYQRLQERQRQRAAAAAGNNGGGPAPTAATGAAGAAASQPTTRPSGVSIGEQLHKGWQELVARRFAKGLPVLDKVVRLDPKDATALEGRGICRYEMGQYKPADKDLEAAYALVNKSGRAPRQTLLALSAASIMADNPMRAVKLVREQMEALDADGKLDEPLQNVLGTALSHADAVARKLPFFQESLRYYEEYDDKLAKQRNDGTRRWGTKWVPASQAEHDWKVYHDTAAAAEAAANRYDHVVMDFKQAEDHYQELHGLRLHGTEEINRVTREFKLAVIAEHKANLDAQKAQERLRNVKKPDFPDKLTFDYVEPR